MHTNNPAVARFGRMLLVTAVALLAGATPAQASADTTNAGAGVRVEHACPTPAVPGKLACQALKRIDVRPRLEAPVARIPSGYGYGPAQLQSAYGLTSASAADGVGRSVAVVDAYDDPTAVSDLATYRAAAGLPAAVVSKVNQNGASSPLPREAPASDDWTLEESLDLDMVSAICPWCRIMLIEADDDTGTGLYAAQNTAAREVGYISDSWGGPESAQDTVLDREYFDHPGTVITASAGDTGYGVSYPASSPHVVSVGGTSLRSAPTARGWTETVWGSAAGGSGTGSGCSAYETKPEWQNDTLCRSRTDNDVALDADPETGVAVYDTSNGNGGWNEVGGTSAAAPMIAAAYALAGRPGAAPAQDIYLHAGSLHSVTTGVNGTCRPSYLCTARLGYNGPSGWGTPDGLAPFTPGTAVRAPLQ